MDRSTRLALFIIALPILACAMSRQVIQPERSRITNYELGQEQSANTGDEIVRVSSAILLPTFTPVSDFITPGVGLGGKSENTVNLKPGQLWVAVSRTTADKGYIITIMGTTAFIHILEDLRMGKGWVWEDGTKPIQGAWPPDIRFEQVDGLPIQGSFEASLLYSGRSGDTIRMVYREYLDGVARPAFTQELEYDLGESMMIAFKSLEIEVIKATNSNIQFKVVEDGGLPWLPNR